MLHYKTANSLFESRLYSTDTTIIQYNLTASAETIEPLQGNKKKALYTNVYSALLIYTINKMYSIKQYQLYD